MNSDDLRTKLSSMGKTAADDRILHGFVAACGGPGHDFFIHAWGKASVIPEIKPMKPDAIFDMASITKAVATASACGICIDRGILDPCAPISDYFAQYTDSGSDSPVRVCDLATHTSGYSNRKFDTYSGEEMLNRIIRSKAEQPPGKRFEYSCLNFILLGLIIEKAAGEDLASICRGNLFEPLNMTDTCFGPHKDSDGRIVPTEQSPGVISDGQARQAGRAVGNAGIFSTARDLGLFCEMMLDPDKNIFNPESRRWLTNCCSPSGLPLRSFGWDMRPKSEAPHRPSLMSDTAIGHGGWTGQSLWIDPGSGIYTIVLTNRTHELEQEKNYETSKEFRSTVADSMIFFIQKRK